MDMCLSGYAEYFADHYLDETLEEFRLGPSSGLSSGAEYHSRIRVSRMACHLLQTPFDV